MATRPLPLQACLGFGGTVGQGLILHPDNKTLIYPLGTTIVLRDKSDLTKQEFLQGHNNRVSCVTVSPTGKYLASGQVAPMGFSSPIIVWDYAGRKIIHRLTLHKVKIQGLDFSFDEELLTSYGGTDDCKLVIWRVKTAEAICGSPTPFDMAIHGKWGNHSRNLLVTTADLRLIVWRVEAENRKLYPSYCDTGKRKRFNQCVVIDDKDEFMYVGTRTGDVMQVSLGPKMYRAGGPKPFIEMGVLCLQFTPFKDLVAGGGDGTVNLLRLPSFKNAKHVKLEGAVTSLAVCPGKGAKGSFEVYAGTSMSQIYLVKYDGATNTMTAALIQRSHFNRINDIAFPANYSDLFCTASSNDIRLWTLKDMKELLRIQVANIECEQKDSINQECLCCSFMPDGKTIISGWSDGRIRAYAPQTGKLQYTIINAHQKMGAFVGSDNTKCFQGVLSLAPTSDSLRIVSGGCRGDVRVWRIGSQSHSLLATMTAHVQGCTYIAVKKDNSECVTCSDDGSCMVWDLNRYSRVNSMGASNFFKCVVYHPDESQILSCGTDRKITFWDAYDCQPIRIIEGSLTAEMLSLDISPDGEGFVSGGGDREVKLWNYDEGHYYFVGLGHSDGITRLKISPDMKKIVSVGADGAILIWNYRKPISDSPPDPKRNVTVKSPGSPN